MVEDEQGEFIDNEVAICRSLIAMIQDEFDEWTE
jgi:hypothetical protein